MTEPAANVIPLLERHNHLARKARRTISFSTVGALVAILCLAFAVLILALGVRSLQRANARLERTNQAQLGALGQLYSIAQANAAELRRLGGNPANVPGFPPFVAPSAASSTTPTTTTRSATTTTTRAGSGVRGPPGPRGSSGPPGPPGPPTPTPPPTAPCVKLPPPVGIILCV